MCRKGADLCSKCGHGIVSIAKEGSNVIVKLKSGLRRKLETCFDECTTTMFVPADAQTQFDAVVQLCGICRPSRQQTV